jgi:Phytanoyl-CoA dioxygenase (PhyH)
MALPAESRARADASKRPAYDIPKLKQEFDENGYLVFRNVVPADRLAQLGQRLQEAFESARASGQLFAGGGLITGHLNCFPGEESRWVYETLEQKGIIDVIRAVHPKAVRLPNIGCNFNLPHSVTQHYHADRHFLGDFIIANVAVIDADESNGATDVIPGTQKKFYKYWRFALERPYRHAKRLTAKQGDVTIRTSNMWHRGMPNHTNTPRPMLAYTWEDGGSTLPDPWKSDDGKITFKQNWYRPTTLGRLRERVYRTAPITYSAYRFVTSMFDGAKGYAHQ